MARRKIMVTMIADDEDDLEQAVESMGQLLAEVESELNVEFTHRVVRDDGDDDED